MGTTAAFEALQIGDAAWATEGATAPPTREAVRASTAEAAERVRGERRNSIEAISAFLSPNEGPVGAV